MVDYKAKFNMPATHALVFSSSPSKLAAAQLPTTIQLIACATMSALPALAARDPPALPVPTTASSAVPLDPAPPATPPLTSGN